MSAEGAVSAACVKAVAGLATLADLNIIYDRHEAAALGFMVFRLYRNLSMSLRHRVGGVY